ncbi:hypothetical protein PoB_000357700 [Plakobranchus ocellatus]|uniref:Reverse transcriptase domain-containing protein n=1 Tax=Plakobranchus ocellatus TaxID=259542 RepID=A0AAV3Y2X0_9GAST|nr:hypothetical protein PoB_000357700 [Plakobranchus ocellatus]
MGVTAWDNQEPDRLYNDIREKMSKDCGVITEIDIGSDHRMVRARIVINSRLERLRRIKRKRPIKINIEILEMHKEQLQLEISNRFNALGESKPTIETFHKIWKKRQKDYKNAFDSVEHAAIVQALRKVNINENYVTITENIYKGATARTHIDNEISEAFKNLGGIRQGDPISPKLFITVFEQVFKKQI